MCDTEPLRLYIRGDLLPSCHKRRNMFVQIAFFFMIAGMQTESVMAIECFSCTNATRIPDCTKRIVCPPGSACFADYATFQGKRFYTLGCKSSWSCPLLSTISTGGVASIVGRSSYGISNCSECCNTNNCNRQLCQNEALACTDEQGYDCAAFGSGFDICGEISHAKMYCRRFCGFCNTVDGGWSSWSEWSACDVSCGTGSRTKSRSCTDPAPENGGSDCPGETNFHENCTKDLCPVHGGWSVWSEWGICSVTCDIGLQRRDRSCSNPFPARYGEHCYGDSRSDRLCFPGACANGNWSAWSSWGPCDKTCNGGVKTRTRNCDNPTPSLTGKYCSGETTQAESCDAVSCRQDGNWSAWRSWGPCDKTCGGGVKTRTRNCDNPAPSLTGNYCSGEKTQAESCNALSCQGPVVFFAKDLSTQSPGTHAELRFTNVTTNIGHGYSSSTGYFTAPVGGAYTFNVQICAASGKIFEIELYVNSGRISYMLLYGDGGHACRTMSVPVVLKTGDKVHVKTGADTYSGQSVIKDSYRMNSFSGALLH